MKTADEIVAFLKSKKDPRNIAGMARFGISSNNTLGVTIPTLRSLAREHKRQHALALELWKTGIHEARILASMVDDPRQVDEVQMEAWVKDFDSWDVCDQVCSNLFKKTTFGDKKALQWARREEEFVKRAGYVLMACKTVADKQAKDEDFKVFYPLLKDGASDERNMVKKAVNWAIRQIGKRNLKLNKDMIHLCEDIRKIDSRSARWIASDALRELKSEAVQNRLLKKRQESDVS